MGKILATGWHEGKHDIRGNDCGLKVGKSNRHLFDDNWDTIELSVE